LVDEECRLELGIAGKKALLCPSNTGLGLACAKAIAAEGMDVFINGRNEKNLKRSERSGSCVKETCILYKRM